MPPNLVAQAQLWGGDLNIILQAGGIMLLLPPPFHPYFHPLPQPSETFPYSPTPSRRQAFQLPVSSKSWLEKTGLTLMAVVWEHR